MRGADEEGTPPELAPAVCSGSRKKWAGLGRLTLYSIFIEMVTEAADLAAASVVRQ